MLGGSSVPVAGWVAAQDPGRRGGHRVSARGLHLRAANHFSTGPYLITHSSAPERRLELWKRHRACWDKVIDLAAIRDARLFDRLARYLEASSTMLPGANRSWKPASSARRVASGSPGTSRICSP